MGLLPDPVSTDYTDKDFDSLKLRLQNLIRSVFPEWTDYNVATFGNILIELYAFVGDVLGFYQDNQALNSRISTATQRRAVLGLVKLIGYVPATATAATVDVDVVLTASPVNDLIIEAGHGILTAEVTDPIRYQVISDTTVLAGASTAVTLLCENAETHEEQFSSSGLANQEFVLSFTPYIDGSQTVVFGNGGYVQVDNFLDSLASDLHFTVIVDQNDRARYRFGNGVNGAIPVSNGTMTYKTGGGSTGRVDATKLTRLETEFEDTVGLAVPVTSITNAIASSGGNDRETVAQIKVNAPASIRVINRSVSKEDFEINALRLSDVARALMLTSNEDVSVAENSGILFIIPTDGGLPSASLKTQALTQVTVTFPSTLTFSVNVQDPIFKVVNVSARIGILQGFDKETIKTDVTTALTEFFAVTNTDGTPNERIDFGGKIKDSAGVIVSELPFSDVFNVVRDVSGIRKILPGQFFLNLGAIDVVLTTREFPQLGTITLIDDDTGLTL